MIGTLFESAALLLQPPFQLARLHFPHGKQLCLPLQGCYWPQPFAPEHANLSPQGKDFEGNVAATAKVDTDRGEE